MTNHGPGSTGALDTTLGGADAGEFQILDDGCVSVLDEDATCSVVVKFLPESRNPEHAELIVADPADGEAVATLDGIDDA